MSDVLVTGATGFIGRHLCRALVERGYTVRGTLRSPAPPADAPAGVEWVNVGEIGPDTDWSAALSGIRYVAHLAGLAHRLDQPEKTEPGEYLRVNAAGTRQLAEALAASPDAQRLVFVSSVAAVKSLSEEIITDATPCHPQNPYGESKRAAEDAVRQVLAAGRPDWCTVRPPLVYGPGNPGNMARLLKMIDAGLPLPVGSIRNRRSFLFIGNLVDALERCLTHAGASRRVFLISDGEDVSTPELVRRLAQHAHRRTRLLPVPAGILAGAARLGDVAGSVLGRSVGLDTYSLQRLCGSLAVDASALRQSIGWEPPFTLDDGIARTIGKLVN